ncbi:hypothetical protein GGS21DRAFT_490079 [Xylaria nigripes]|nr:hypothetical protein GGS21DRAFT_490079 [Xylaria nigripes]
MKSTIQTGALLALAFSELILGWNMTIYDSANCTGNYYEVYPTAQYTKYFEMDGSYGVDMVCTFHGEDDSTDACREQFPVGKSVFSAVGRCHDFSGSYSTGEQIAEQDEGECKTTKFDILSVVCYDP